LGVSSGIGFYLVSSVGVCVSQLLTDLPPTAREEEEEEYLYSDERYTWREREREKLY
jgi:hypothetical protein